ncbi:MOSC domain-containing protein [Aestuariibius insulae]|uniref:MOSC domain-containing protein n=1 Tax=Aestuariibius insulae TaxID=2058287 RepID=UPI00345E5025
MPALIKTDYIGKLTWLGRVLDREAALRSTELTEVEARFSGLEGEAHGGLTRPSCSRVVTQYPKGTEIRNVRQLSIVSREELDQIAKESGLDDFDPAWIGASLVVEGIPDFTHIPPSSRLQAGSGATLTVDMENRPCHLPAKVIDEDQPGYGAAFKAAAKGRRGVTAWVEREGVLSVGDTVTLHVPAQRLWKP